MNPYAVFPAHPITIRGLLLRHDRSFDVIPESERHNASEVSLQPGRITVLMGANGAGKTHFMEVIAGLREPGTLETAFGEESVWTRRGSRRRKGKLSPQALLAYGYASQAPEEQLFMRSVRDELAYTLRPYSLPAGEREARMAAALSAVGWNEAWLSRDPYRMSGGERRRTALAALFAPPAAWLLLDEPTAGLDAGGYERLGSALKQRAAEGQGILLISHESDWAMELADSLILMHGDGSIRMCTSTELIHHPEWLAEAGMDVPEWFEVAAMLASSGVNEAHLWDPRKLDSEDFPEQPAEQGSPLPAQPVTLSAAVGIEAPTRHHGTGNRRPFAVRSHALKPSPIASFDARAVWLTYVILSAAILNLSTWPGLGFAALLVAACLYFGRISLRRWSGAIKAVATFTIAISLFAGLGHHEQGSWWQLSGALLSLKSLLRPLLVMLIGFGIPLAVTPLRLRRSMEQLFTVFGRVPLWGTKLLLTITLLLRFIPILLSEWERFARISTARGKLAGQGWRGGVRRLQETALPFMLSLFRLGEQAADALESRGVGTQKHPTVLVTASWRRSDTLLVLAGLAAAGLLWLVK
ncbi:ATP-binding cassette domain-containing protein [Paenibacillus sp. R14(2021)]|uniref:ATP-binding cassette domain-containing protein n=1 Tax=Paenibacillus sp. R14(2021) TaxID=2859228 RepID=UPI001C614314|nr:ATP-binding cassette domain-containing protein [Paenibacillus sp. R14(2021)]